MITMRAGLVYERKQKKNDETYTLCFCLLSLLPANERKNKLTKRGKKRHKVPNTAIYLSRVYDDKLYLCSCNSYCDVHRELAITCIIISIVSFKKTTNVYYIHSYLHNVWLGFLFGFGSNAFAVYVTLLKMFFKHHPHERSIEGRPRPT